VEIPHLDGAHRVTIYHSWAASANPGNWVGSVLFLDAWDDETYLSDENGANVPSVPDNDIPGRIFLQLRNDDQHFLRFGIIADEPELLVAGDTYHISWTTSTENTADTDWAGIGLLASIDPPTRSPDTICAIDHLNGYPIGPIEPGENGQPSLFAFDRNRYVCIAHWSLLSFIRGD
jgi:hypothetical protein